VSLLEPLTEVVMHLLNEEVLYFIIICPYFNYK